MKLFGWSGLRFTFVQSEGKSKKWEPLRELLDLLKCCVSQQVNKRDDQSWGAVLGYLGLVSYLSCALCCWIRLLNSEHPDRWRVTAGQVHVVTQHVLYEFGFTQILFLAHDSSTHQPESIAAWLWSHADTLKPWSLPVPPLRW